MTVRKVTTEALADNSVTADKINPSFISDFPTASALDLTQDLVLVYDTSEGLLKKTCFQDVPVNISNYYTCDILECNNLYFTIQRARDSICNGGDLAYDPSTGELSVTTYKSSNFDTDFSGKTTTDLAEGTNLYYTTTRANTDFDTRLGAKTTTDLAEGTNLYYTDARADARVDLETGVNLDLSQKTTTDLAEGTNLYYTDARVNTLISNVTGINLDISNKDTDDLTEGSTNLYYTDARARTSVCQGTGVSYNNSTGEISIGQAVGTTDNVTFNNVTVSGNLKGPASFIIDPAAYGDATGTVYIAGNLEVQGLTTTVNSETVTIVDKNIVLASGSPSAISTDGAGITIDVANATFTYDATNDRWTANKNINANIIGTVSDISNHDTDALSEGSTNLYYTTSRFNTAFSGKSTDDLGEGSTNLYYTTTRFDTRFGNKTTDDLGEGSSNLYYTDSRVNTLIAGVTGANLDLSQKTTTDLAEGTNLYYTDARVDARIASQASGGGVSLGLAIALG